MSVCNHTLDTEMSAIETYLGLKLSPSNGLRILNKDFTRFLQSPFVLFHLVSTHQRNLEMYSFRRVAVRLLLVTFLLGLVIIVFIGRQVDKVAFNRVVNQNNNITRNDASTDTVVRNENQLQGSNGASKLWLILFWSTIFEAVPTWIEVAWKKGDCPVACEVTVNHSRSSEADAFIVHARDAHMIPPTHSVPWILFTHENPVYTPVLRDSKFMSQFNLLRSYRLDSDFPDPIFGIPQLTPPLPFNEKSGLIFAAFSNCEAVRTEYMRQLMSFVQVDSYGSCLRNKNDLVARYGENFKSAKTDLAKKYKFTLVFFNQDCDYFVDDRLTHALTAGSVPVVMGTDKLDEFLPINLQNSVIKVRDFKSPQHLADYLQYLSRNEIEYNKFLDWKRKGFGDITGTAIGYVWKRDYPIYCQICVALSQGKVHKEGLQAIPCKPRAFEDWGIVRGA